MEDKARIENEKDRSIKDTKLAKILLIFNFFVSEITNKRLIIGKLIKVAI